jgi:hypothetical protein
MAIQTKKPLTTERQRELMRVINECFDEFAKRNQTYYALDGMTTAHITLHAIQDFTTLKAFWPKELVDNQYGRTTYLLNDDTMSKVQSSVRDSLNQLFDKAHIERIGNEHERRWRPVKEKVQKQTKTVYDAFGRPTGVMELVNKQWILQ